MRWMSSKPVTSCAIAAAVALMASGCAGGSRSGSDQPGVQGPRCAVGAPAGSVTKVPINESSEDDIAAILRTCEVAEPQRWAQIVAGSRPFPPGERGEQRLRQVLVEHGAEPAELEKITGTLTP